MTARFSRQILEEVCRKQGASPDEYGLKFQRSMLDLSLQWRFAKLPNNAKLEMVPVSRNRVGMGNTVRIALHLDDGSRLQDTFLCQQTLWELLNHFAVDTMAQCNELTVRAGSTEKTVDVPLTRTHTFPEDLDHSDVALSLHSCRNKQDFIRESHASLEELSPPSERESAPFVPFSGDGQRLGDSPVTAVSPGLDMPSSKLPISSSSPGGPSKPKKSKNSQELLKEQEQLLEREPLVCHLDLLEPLPAGPEDLPDEFFEVTVDDVRKRLAQLQSERKRLEEAPLMTKSLREAQLKEKLERYPKVVLRVHFPDRHVLQGFFRPSETVGILRDFVRSHLADADLPFYLFIAPPRIILNDESLTLFEVRTHTCALSFSL
uniref:ASPSCR1 tether for SLC2A4, UBX domain containing n=1 Tax=Apteryx owenii TaxID=8824 RepID=A0A8B9NYD0_APTOW